MFSNRNYRGDEKLYETSQGKSTYFSYCFSNVQSNFRLQLFDDRKLKLENGVWNLNTCVGNSLLKEINPSMTLNLTRDKVITN